MGDWRGDGRVVLLLRELERVSQGVFGCLYCRKHMVCIGLASACIWKYKRALILGRLRKWIKYHQLKFHNTGVG